MSNPTILRIAIGDYPHTLPLMVVVTYALAHPNPQAVAELYRLPEADKESTRSSRP